MPNTPYHTEQAPREETIKFWKSVLDRAIGEKSKAEYSIMEATRKLKEFGVEL